MRLTVVTHLVKREVVPSALSRKALMNPVNIKSSMEEDIWSTALDPKMQPLRPRLWMAERIVVSCGEL
jgi:hypothetical protein